jgi:1-acyl-sn-glycerol-3-phosphate acyltransferase
MTIGRIGKRILEATTLGVGRPIARNFIFNKYLDVRLRGERLPVKGAAVCVPPHITFFDGLLNICYLERHVHLMMQREGLYNTNMKPLYWASGNFPISIERKSSITDAVKKGKAYLREGEIIGIFSEGPASRLMNDAGEIVPLADREHYPLAAYMAIENNVPIIPFGLFIDPEISKRLWQFRGYNDASEFLKDYMIRKTGDKTGKTQYRIPYIIYRGSPVSVSGYNRKRSSIVELTREVKSQIEVLSDKARDFAHVEYIDLMQRID